MTAKKPPPDTAAAQASSDRGYPLEGLRVLDLSRILAGPICCQLLADLGADVVKVERPDTGDDTRAWGPPFLENDGPSAYYLSANRGKRSVAIDLEQPAARELLEDLLRQADVVVENFLPRTVAKLGLEPQRLRELNPALVGVSISGYGRTGPSADAPGYDLMVQATSGLMSITGEPDGMPSKVGVAISDIITGLYGATSALAGLFARGKGRGGMSFDLALADCSLASLVNVAQASLITGERPGRYGNAHAHIVPYGAFATADGYLVVGIGNDRQWQRLCAAAARDDLARDPRFATNPQRVEHREALLTDLNRLFAGQTTAEWEKLLAGADIPFAPVLAVDQALASPQAVARGMVTKVRDDQGREFPILAGPVRWEGRAARPAICPPALGQHTDEVLGEWLGYDAARIADLHSRQVVA